ncbi:MAG: hypothetical protein RLZZ359_471 [Actinomycetota bacterium]
MSDQFPGLHASQYNNNYSEAEASSEVVQDAVRQHYEFCLQFWVPTRAAYKGLALSYLLPSPYRDSYEAVAEGLGKFTHDAVVIWADKNLS